MSSNIVDAVFQVGMADRELWKFHSEANTAQGDVPHDARLVRDKKTVLEPCKEFVANLRFGQQGWTK